MYTTKKQAITCHEYRVKNFRAVLLSETRQRAVRKGLEFTLTKEYWNTLWEQTIYCPYLLIVLDKFPSKGTTRNLRQISIDRIDSSKGYIEDNIQFVSYAANVMKANCCPIEFRSFLDEVFHEDLRSRGLPEEPRCNFLEHP